MSPLRQLFRRLSPVLSTIGFLLTFLWRRMREKDIEDSDLIGGVSDDDQCNATTTTHHVDKESMDTAEVSSVAEVPVRAGQSAPKRVANTDEDVEETINKRLKTEENDLTGENDLTEDEETVNKLLKTEENDLTEGEETTNNLLKTEENGLTGENDLTEDELYCEYDSTWEETSASSELKSSNKRFGHQRRTSNKFDRFKNASRDMWNYRHDYPGKTRSHRSWHQEPQMPNLEFYIGNIRSAPDGIYIEEFHSDWFEDYYQLEYTHTFIQWLFPLQEPGLNNQAKELTKEEIQAFCKNTVAKQNLLESYKLMLDFYGIYLSNEETGQVVRASNWEERSDHLNSHSHNFLRISRILKCLGTLGYSRYQAPLVHFFLQETLVHGNLPNMKESLLNYYMFAVLDKTERKGLVRFAYLNRNRQEEFVWCPKTIQMRWLKQVTLPYVNPPNVVMNQDDEANGTTDNAQNVWSSTSKPSADASPSMKENPKSLTNSDTSPGTTRKPGSEFEIQGDKADANEETDGTVSKSDHGSTTKQTMEGGHRVPLKKMHSSSTVNDSNEQNAPPAHSPSAEAVFGQERSLPREDFQGNSERNEKATDVSATQIHGEERGHIEDVAADEAARGSESRLPDAGPPGPEHQMNKNTSLRVQKDLDSVSPLPVGGEDGTAEKGPDGDHERVEVLRN